MPSRSMVRRGARVRLAKRDRLEVARCTAIDLDELDEVVAARGQAFQVEQAPQAVRAVRDERSSKQWFVTQSAARAARRCRWSTEHTGAFSADELLGVIFSNFCIGK